jgi:hypothetical protein
MVMIRYSIAIMAIGAVHPEAERQTPVWHFFNSAFVGIALGLIGILIGMSLWRAARRVNEPRPGMGSCLLTLVSLPFLIIGFVVLIESIVLLGKGHTSGLLNGFR